MHEAFTAKTTRLPCQRAQDCDCRARQHRLLQIQTARTQLGTERAAEHACLHIRIPINRRRKTETIQPVPESGTQELPHHSRPARQRDDVERAEQFLHEGTQRHATVDPVLL